MTAAAKTLAPELPVRGLGAFLTSADVARLAGTAGKDEAAAMAACGLSWAAIWVESYDDRRASLAAVQRAAAALRAHRIVPVVWTFPAPSAARAAALRLGAAAKALRAPLAILDIEDPDGKTGPMDWEPADARALIDTTIDELTEHTMLAVTSYPGRSGHGLPWGELVAGIGMPQIYGTADSPAKARTAVESWRKAHGQVIPITSLRSPGSQSANISPERLRKRIAAVSIEGVSAVGIWSWALVRGSATHRRTLAESPAVGTAA